MNSLALALNQIGDAGAIAIAKASRNMQLTILKLDDRVKLRLLLGKRDLFYNLVVQEILMIHQKIILAHPRI